MIYGIDSAYAPTRYQAGRIFSLGWRWSICYVGGPRATNKWTNAQTGTLATAGFTFVPTYVGRNAPWDGPEAFTFDQGAADGVEADVQTGACGFDGTTILALDLEYGSYQAHPAATLQYVLGWVSQVNAAGHPAVLYSDPHTIAYIGTPDIVDFTWGASYVANGRSYLRPPVGSFDPSSPPAWSAWQWADNGLIAGAGVDLNSAVDDFPFASYTPPA